MSSKKETHILKKRSSGRLSTLINNNNNTDSSTNLGADDIVSNESTEGETIKAVAKINQKTTKRDSFPQTDAKHESPQTSLNDRKSSVTGKNFVFLLVFE